MGDEISEKTSSPVSEAEPKISKMGWARSEPGALCRRLWHRADRAVRSERVASNYLDCWIIVVPVVSG
jgi:hypothetical protein